MTPSFPLLRALLAGALLSLALVACGGGDASPPAGDGPPAGGGDLPPTGGGDLPPTAPGQPAVTAVGTVLGEAVSAAIGPAGGSLISGDGQATLVVPPGALATTTTLTMAPVTSQVPGGVVAWRFGPSGLNFQVPAILRLRGVDASRAPMTALATQTSAGNWQPASRATVDTVDGEVAFEVPHFSDWAFYERFYLTPARATVMVKDQLTLNAFEVERKCVDDDSPLDSDCLLTALSGDAPVKRWSVNGIVGGNAQVGTITVVEEGRAVYHAPAQVPAGNPVSIAAHIDAGDGAEVQLLSHVRVEPASVLWSGEITLSFMGLQVAEEGAGTVRHQVLFEATHVVDSVNVDAPGDGGAVTASLTMHVPTLDYHHQYRYKEPGFESLEEISSREASDEFYDGDVVGFRSSLTLNALADGRMQVPVGSLLAYLDARGQRAESRFDGTTGQYQITRDPIEQPLLAGPDLSAVPTGVMLLNPITGAPMGPLPGTFEGQRVAGAGEVWAGDTTLDNIELVFEGRTIRGSLRARWQFSRRMP